MDKHCEEYRIFALMSWCGILWKDVVPHSFRRIAWSNAETVPFCNISHQEIRRKLPYFSQWKYVQNANISNKTETRATRKMGNPHWQCLAGGLVNSLILAMLPVISKTWSIYVDYDIWESRQAKYMRWKIFCSQQIFTRKQFFE